ncbi:hypothetical protein ACOMHN_053859 [Nucella lapillus]
MFVKAFGLLAFVVLLTVFWKIPLWAASVAAFALYLATPGGWRYVVVALKTMPRDARGLYTLLKINLKVRYHTTENSTIAALFQARVKQNPQKPCLVFEDDTWTFQQLEDFTNQVANVFHEAGYGSGDTVAIFLDNCPQYVGLWLGLSKLGVVTALVNFNVRQESLAHCIRDAEPKALIFGASMAEAVAGIVTMLPADLQLFRLGQLTASTSDPTPSPTPLDQLLATASSSPPPPSSLLDTPQSFRDKLFYVYTSGTTGLPKAAVVTHTRYFYMSYGVNQFYGIRPCDVIYDTLPLYHTAGGILGVGQMILCGATIVIRRKFSASQFWSDCVKYRCTVAQYIGEICRYLLAQPYRPEETQHAVRLMFGNGIKANIWTHFQSRFGVPLIGEFYGATEGNCNIVNFENRVGAVGFTSRIAPWMYPVTLVKVDPVSGDAVRDSQGLCLHAQPGELGELAGKIVKGDPVREFDGYVNKKATEKKILHDVFWKGDTAFMTGDVLLMDELGYLYFHDRTGDTFRWRGENVSTSEVEAVISSHLGLRDAVVYGVHVPGLEGSAGMAAIADEDDSVDVEALSAALHKSLPAYARPVFLRLLQRVDTTGTFKLKKTELRSEGFDPNSVNDRLLYFNSSKGKYTPVTPSVYSDICSGKIRL